MPNIKQSTEEMVADAHAQIELEAQRALDQIRETAETAKRNVTLAETLRGRLLFADILRDARAVIVEDYPTQHAAGQWVNGEFEPGATSLQSLEIHTRRTDGGYDQIQYYTRSPSQRRLPEGIKGGFRLVIAILPLPESKDDAQ